MFALAVGDVDGVKFVVTDELHGIGCIVADAVDGTGSVGADVDGMTIEESAVRGHILHKQKTITYLSVDLKYWYPEEPPVPNCEDPIILCTISRWLSKCVCMLQQKKYLNLPYLPHIDIFIVKNGNICQETAKSAKNKSKMKIRKLHQSQQDKSTKMAFATTIIIYFLCIYKH
ncbi:unnamed protein product [Acanthoscelides obtectus]|uniref:Uncharacterized protein n=1 Tax=Acanthoscelides obtectus TaxID=200917 RepID=A0A9P0KN67_ACAOB|nr:unnamed protein product [Acanthoscelides obtectus]CAK1685084.1 hypothetical protein AOBTE_LOCUS35225 [Acanthoscelides obtectus]